jgi:hypothetical protein
MPSFADMIKVEKNVEGVDSLRSALSQTITSKADEKLFKQVCKPVGIQIKNIKKTESISIRQASHKPRNPKHLADPDEMLAISLLQKRKDVDSLWLDIDGKKHYFKRITVEKNCLSCHGAKSLVPSFVKAKYPGDRAYNFKEGDLRGVYHVKLN